MNREELCKEVNNALNNFRFCGKADVAQRYGNGHINDTFITETDEGKKYIVQRINTDIFTDPEGLMNNIKLVTDHLRTQTIAEGGDAEREVMQIIPTAGGKLFFTDKNGSAWRAYDFVTDSLSLDRPRNPNDTYIAAQGFGKFASRLVDFDASVLTETIPHFHDTPRRYAALIRAVSADKCMRTKEVYKEIEFAGAREQYTLKLAHSSLPLRVTHNDTKLNNILFDKDGDRTLCVIDLDTVMPGYSVTDFGDFVRVSASTAAEDEADLSKVDIDLELYEKCVSGFISGCGGRLTGEELLLLHDGARMMTLECGIRFLTDYLEGDVYFRTAYPEHNLVRCRNQFRLVQRMEEKSEEMKAIAQKYL